MVCICKNIALQVCYIPNPAMLCRHAHNLLLHTYLAAGVSGTLSVGILCIGFRCRCSPAPPHPSYPNHCHYRQQQQPRYLNGNLLVPHQFLLSAGRDRSACQMLPYLRCCVEPATPGGPPLQFHEDKKPTARVFIITDQQVMYKTAYPNYFPQDMQ